jgi:membrane protein required for colicin V production
MNWLDIVVLIVIALFSLAGLKNGIIRTALSLLGMIAGIMLAGNYYGSLAPVLTFISNGDIANIAAFIIILMAVVVVSGITAGLLTYFVKAILLGWLNSLLGGVFGFCMGVLATSALLTIWVKFRGPDPAVTDSTYAAALLGYFPVILSLLPEEFASIRDFFR